MKCDRKAALFILKGKVKPPTTNLYHVVTFFPKFGYKRRPDFVNKSVLLYQSTRVLFFGSFITNLPPADLCPSSVLVPNTLQVSRPSFGNRQAPGSGRGLGTSSVLHSPGTGCTGVCPPNEEYSQCGSNACQNTCVDPTLEQLSSGCSCSPGCVCIPGLLRNQGGLCVAPEDCNIVTSCFFENEVFSKCDAHPCQNTCADPDLITRCDYTAGCYPGCNCAEGYLRSLENNCVLATSNTCVKKCPGPNEIYRESESGCRGTCLTKYIFEGVDLATVSMACVLPSTAGGCYCQIDYVLNEKTNQCVLPDNCPPPCEPNEVFDMCPPKSPAEVTCVNIFKGTTPVKPTECVMECKCKPGLVRIGKECVAPEKCCSDPNAELVKNPHCCGGGTCAKPDWITGCGKKYDTKGCQCKKGYCKKSETDATCIAVKNCKKPTTGHCSK